MKKRACIHCGHELDDEFIWYGGCDIHVGDGDTSDVACPSCEKPIRIHCHHEIHFEVGEVTDD